MSRVPRIVSATALVAALVAAMAAPRTLLPKTIVLGFDGMDFTLTGRFIEEGALPNFERLAKRGLFQPLETSNPAQSPVSWAVFNTGSNPGKTGVAGFVGRFFPDLGGKKGPPMPQPMLGFDRKIPADDFVRFPMALHHRLRFVLLVGMAFFVVGLVLFRFLIRTGGAVALGLALVAGCGAGWLARGYAEELPADGKLPYKVNPMQGTNFWSYLDRQGVRTRGIQLPSTYPPDAEGPRTALLSGLGIPDIGGSPGSWFVYTDDPWVLSDRSTDTAGRVVKVYEDEPGMVQAELQGPRDWVGKARHEQGIASLEEMKNSPRLSTGDLAELEGRIADAKAEYKSWKRQHEKLKVPFTMKVDREGHEVAFTVQGQTITLEQGGWSEFLPVEFAFNGRYSAHGNVRFHVLRCDSEELRVFVPPINIDPEQPPAWLPLSAPAAFSAELVAALGHPYESIGWPPLTNPLKDGKDSHLEAQSFFDALENTMRLREELLAESLDQADTWEVYLQVFGSTDRLAHMFMRETDPDHPLYDEAYANRKVKAWGRTFPLKQAVKEVYREADRIVGGVLARVESGEFGDDCLLLVVSDHGFTSFRRGVNLNNLLLEQGHLALKDGQTLQQALRGKTDFLRFVDWSRTQAYSLGLGKVFINLKGREPEGIVSPEQYDEVVEAIRADLLEVTDGPGGPKVVTSVERRDALFSGPWWKEGRAARRVRGHPEPVNHDGFADLFLGYAPTYRVSWANTMGGLDEQAIVDNTNHWSGGHVSVDPSHVQGILLANRPFAAPSRSGLEDIGPTLLQRYGIDPGTTEMDGSVLPFATRSP